MAEHKNVYEALRAAQDEFPAITQNCENPHFKSRYADLGAILGAVTPVLRAHDLDVVQAVVTDHDGSVLATTLRHHGEQSHGAQAIESSYPLPRQDDPQKLGSALTYARRYALSTLLGIVTEKDDDGNAAAAQQQPRRQRSTTTRRSEKPKTEDKPAAAAPKADFFSDEDRTQAHNELAARIKKLPDEQQGEARKAREAHGWPMPHDKFQQLAQYVTLCESGGE